MTKSAQDRLGSVMRHGQIVMTMDGKNNSSGRLYRTNESRGYKTGFRLKNFFYIATFQDGFPVDLRGVSKDARRKNIFNHLKKQGISYTVVDREALEEWMS